MITRDEFIARAAARATNEKDRAYFAEDASAEWNFPVLRMTGDGSVEGHGWPGGRPHVRILRKDGSWSDWTESDRFLLPAGGPRFRRANRRGEPSMDELAQRAKRAVEGGAPWATTWSVPNQEGTLYVREDAALAHP